jgi:uncharacterized protein YhbP (UPF0306 family)
MEAVAVNIMDKHIVQFLTAQTVMTIATSENNIPHCATCFYVFIPEENLIVFKSKPGTTHVKQALANSIVAGSVLPDKFVAGKTSGIQFYGSFGAAKDGFHDLASKHYYKKYPFAAVMPGKLWVIELNKVVFTDHTLGFGKKRNWEK